MTEGQSYIILAQFLCLVWIVKVYRTFFNLSDHQALSCAILICSLEAFVHKQLPSCFLHEQRGNRHKTFKGPTRSIPATFGSLSRNIFFPFRGQHCYYLPPLITSLQMSKKQHQLGAAGQRDGGRRELTLLVLGERMAAMWSKEHPMRLINLKTILPEIATATATTCLSVPFQEFQSLFLLLWKLTTLLPKEFIIPTTVCCSSQSGVSKEGMQTQGMEELTGGSWWLEKTSQGVRT